MDTRGVAGARPFAPDDPGFGFPRFEKKSWAGVTGRSRKSFRTPPGDPSLPSRGLRAASARPWVPWIGRHPVHVASARPRAVLSGGLARVAVVAEGLQVGCVVCAAVLEPRDMVDLDGFGHEPLPHALSAQGVQPELTRTGPPPLPADGARCGCGHGLEDAAGMPGGCITRGQNKRPGQISDRALRFRWTQMWQRFELNTKCQREATACNSIGSGHPLASPTITLLDCISGANDRFRINAGGPQSHPGRPLITVRKYLPGNCEPLIQKSTNYPERVSMNAGTRACIAYIAGRLITRGTGGNIYDFSRSKHFSFSGSVEAQRVNVYDHDRSCHFGGTPPSLYDFGGRHHVRLELNGQQFSGYDFGAQHHFRGSVQGTRISLYDFGESKHFHFNL